MEFVAYNIDSGFITKMIHAPNEKEAALQANSDEDICAGVFDVDTTQFVNGEPVVIEKAQMSLAAAQATIKKRVKALRDQIASLVPFEGKLIQSNESSKIQILAIVVGGTMPESAANWRTYDNTALPMNYEKFQLLYSTIMNWEGGAYVRSAFHQDAINALTDSAAVLAYDYSTGWPEYPS